jgi:type IV pilus modification protein PilV
VSGNAYRSAQNGFLVIEAAIAFLLVSLGIVGLLMLSARNSRATQEAFERTEAIALANQIVSSIRASGDGVLEWNGVDVANSTTWTSTNPATLTTLGQLKEITVKRLYQTVATVALRAPDGVSTCATLPCEIEVSIQWRGASDAPRQYALYSWVGLQ